MNEQDEIDTELTNEIDKAIRSSAQKSFGELEPLCNGWERIHTPTLRKDLATLIHQAEITADKNLVGWIERNHIEPDSDTDRWCLASKEIRDHINEHIEALEKEIVSNE